MSSSFDIESLRRVLSIQSHVVSGYVGNKAATFPLQFLGYEVDAVNSVQFSNHTGYGHTNGHKTTAEHLEAVFTGLSDNGLLSPYERILTGYVPGAEALQVVAEQVAKVRRLNPNVIYLLDPVMGDIGRGLYVAEQVIPIYKEMLSLATIITPNHFEIEILSETKLTSLSTLRQALLLLHEKHGLPHIVISSITLPSRLVAVMNIPPPPDAYTRLLGGSTPARYSNALDPASPQDSTLVCLASTYRGGRLSAWAFALPTVHGYFAGVGDLFSSLVLAHYYQEAPEGLRHAVSQALLGVQGILLSSHTSSMRQDMESPGPADLPSDSELDAAGPRTNSDPSRRAKRMRLRELRIIPNRSLLSGDAPHGWQGAEVLWDSPQLASYRF